MRNRTKRLATIANNTQFCSTAQDRFLGLTGNNLTAQNVNFTQNTFYREFSDAPAITLQLSLQAFQAKERQTQVRSVIDACANTSRLGDAKARNPASTLPRGYFQWRQKRVTQAAGCKRGLGRRANQRCGMNYLYCYQ